MKTIAANTGLGLEIARQLGKLQMTVLLGARNEESAQKAAARLVSEGIVIGFHPYQLCGPCAGYAGFFALFKAKPGRPDREYVYGFTGEGIEANYD